MSLTWNVFWQQPEKVSGSRYKKDMIDSGTTWKFLSPNEIEYLCHRFRSSNREEISSLPITCVAAVSFSSCVVKTTFRPMCWSTTQARSFCKNVRDLSGGKNFFCSLALRQFGAANDISAFSKSHFSISRVVVLIVHVLSQRLRRYLRKRISDLSEEFQSFILCFGAKRNCRRNQLRLLQLKQLQAEIDSLELWERKRKFFALCDLRKYF